MTISGKKKFMKKKDNDTNSNFKLKLKHLGERYEDANRFFKRTLYTITGIITVLSIILAVLSFVSKSDVTVAIREMERKSDVLSQKVTDAVREMERKFDVLSQQALKLPRLEIFYKDELASGKTITIPLSDDTITLNKLFIKNTGEKIANNISIKIYWNNSEGSDPYFLINAGLQNWDINASSHEKFPWVIKLKEILTLSPKDAWSFPVLKLDPANRPIYEILLDALMKVEVYYGLEEPVITEIKFEKSRDKN